MLFLNCTIIGKSTIYYHYCFTNFYIEIFYIFFMLLNNVVHVSENLLIGLLVLSTSWLLCVDVLLASRLLYYFIALVFNIYRYLCTSKSTITNYIKFIDQTLIIILYLRYSVCLLYTSRCV